MSPAHRDPPWTARRWILAGLPAVLLGGGLLGGCGPRTSGGEDADLLLLAASDLGLAFEDLVPAYESRAGERIAVVLGSTGNLAAQIRHGAPADLFFSADESFMDALIGAGHIEAASRTVYATGRLALVAPPGNGPPPPLETLAEPAFGVIAIANPEHAPYGRAAREALESVALWEPVTPRLVLGENVAHALQFVRTGNADAGLVALSLVLSAPVDAAVPYRVVDEGHHLPLRQVAGITTTTRRAERARAFLDFVVSPEGQQVLARYGFEPPVP